MVFSGRQIFNRDTFTASKDLQTLSGGKYIDRLRLHWNGVNTGPNIVSVASMLDLVNPIEVRKRGSTIFRMRGSDLLGLNAHFFGEQPLTIVGTAATSDHTKIMGMDVPLWLPAAPLGEYSVVVTRAAVTNSGTETISLTEVSSDKNLTNSHLHAVDIPATTNGGTGFGNFINLPANLGDLLGVMFYSTTIPTNTAETTTVDSVRVLINNRLEYSANWHEMKGDSQYAGNSATWNSPATNAILDNYAVLDFRRDPIPMGNLLQLDINGGVASEAYRVIPIFAVPHKV